MKQQVNLEIMQFVETQILPKYTEFGESHGLRHVTRVIKNALKLVPVTGADIDMVYIVAAYHDLGMSGPRAIHHLTSGKILQADARLKRWFTPEQIKIMKEAVEDHRASSSRQPRSIYGKIVAEADRDIHIHEIFSSCHRIWKGELSRKRKGRAMAAVRRPHGREIFSQRLHQALDSQLTQ